MDVGFQQRQCLEQIETAFVFDQPADKQHDEFLFGNGLTQCCPVPAGKKRNIDAHWNDTRLRHFRIASGGGRRSGIRRPAIAGANDPALDSREQSAAQRKRVAAVGASGRPKDLEDIRSLGD